MEITIAPHDNHMVGFLYKIWSVGPFWLKTRFLNRYILEIQKAIYIYSIPGQNTTIFTAKPTVQLGCQWGIYRGYIAVTNDFYCRPQSCSNFTVWCVY